MDAKRWLQFAVCVLLLLNAGCDFDNSSHTFADTGIAKFDRHENDTVEDLELWTILPETNEKGIVKHITEKNFQQEVFSNSEISDDAGRINHPVHSESQERNRNHLVRQPTQEELRESLDRINKVISRIEKVLVAQQQ